MTTVVILNSGRPTNRGMRTLPPVSKELYKNKALMTIADGRSILDLQMAILTKNNLTNIYMIVGYRKDEVIQHCKEKNYNIKFVEDTNWEHGAYSSGRTLWEQKDFLLSLPTPIITLYHDVIFNQEILDKIMRCNADVCSVYNGQNIVKWSKKGITELLNILEEEEMRHNLDGLSYPVWGRIRWNDNITWKTFYGGFLFNLTNDGAYNRLKELKI